MVIDNQFVHSLVRNKDPVQEHMQIAGHKFSNHQICTGFRIPGNGRLPERIKHIQVQGRAPAEKFNGIFYFFLIILGVHEHV